MNVPNEPIVRYCRSCGGALPPNSRAAFHPVCLAADKRLRVARQSARIERALAKRLERVRRRMNVTQFADGWELRNGPASGKPYSFAADYASAVLEAVLAGATKTGDGRRPSSEASASPAGDKGDPQAGALGRPL